MGLNNPFTRGVVQRLLNDPNVRRAVNKVKTQVQRHPTTQKFINDMKNKFKAAGGAAPVAGANKTSNSSSNNTSNHHNQQQQQQAAGAEAGKQSGEDFFTKGQKYWEQHRERVIAFVAANFMGILFFIQFGQQLWHLAVIAWRSTGDQRAVEEKKKKRPRAQQQQQQQAQAAPGPVRSVNGVLQLSLNLDESSDGRIVSSFMDDPQLAFEESFSVKMGDSKEFQSSLDSSFVTGDSSSTSKGLLSGFLSSGESSEELVFDMRYQSSMTTTKY